MDRLRLERIRASGRHGVYAAERERPQPFDIDVTLRIDLRRAAASDDIADTVDYARLHTRIVRIVETTSYALLERLTARLFEEIFDDPRVRSAEVAIAKPALLDGATPSVTMKRTNPNGETQ